MAAASFSVREPHLAGVRVLVVGLGRSGVAAMGLLAAKGARVTAADQRDEASLGSAARRARALGADLRAGGHPTRLAEEADLVVVSPGVPLDVPVLAAARRLGIPIWSEVELAFRFCRGKIIGITGSNGKSTVTSMTGKVLRSAGIPGGTGGNLGTPLSELLDLDERDAVHAVELSSFQLEAIDRFRAAVAVVLNLSPDHLDRYPSVETYAAAKARLLETQSASGHAVLNADDAASAVFTSSVRGRTHRFSTRSEVADGACVLRGRIVLRLGGAEEDILGVSDLPVVGEHNVANALAAAVACRLVGCSTIAIADGLASYKALPHRLQNVGVLDEVAFYDDSKATNLDAAARAIQSFPPHTVHLILGGKDKGAHWPDLVPLVRRHARRVLLVGQAAERIRAAMEDAVPLVDCGTVEAAVRCGFEGARPGDVVLLAPGCASFDQYRNFEERGDDFRRAVEALLRDGGGRG